MDLVTVTAERRRRGLSIVDVARHLGITREAYSQIERGLIDITDEYAEKMATAIEAAAGENGAHVGG